MNMTTFAAGDIAVLGRKGGGKTYTSKGIVEWLLDAGRRVLILDPLGVWAGLRTSADGEGPGFPIAIFGGEHADLPLDPAAGAAMARIIAKENLPAVIDLSELSKSKQQEFLLKFLSELRRVNSDDLTLVLEEADVFAPQNPQGDDSKQLHGEIDWIARRGRFKGFRLISITQRPARLSKDVLTQASTLIAHRLPAPQDRDAVKAWVEGNGDRDKAREVFDTLARLEVGEAWVWATEADTLERVKFPRIKTLDTSATPKAGQSRVLPKTLADVDVSGIRAALHAATEPAKTEKVSTDPAAIDAARAAGYQAGHAAGLDEGLRRGRQVVVDRVMAALGEAPAVPVRASAPTPKPPREPRPAPEGLPAAAAKMLAVLDTNPPIRISWNALAAAIGNKARGGHFNTMRKAMQGHIIEEGGLVRIAEPSASAAPPISPDAMAEHLRGQWKGILGGRPAQIIDLLNERPRSRADIAAALNCAPTGGHWNSAWKALRDNDLVEEAGGIMRLAEELR